MSIMFSQTTRLELIIVVAALLVLLFCSQPPKSGNAEVSTDAESMPEEAQTTAPTDDSFENSTPGDALQSPIPNPQSGDIASDNPGRESTSPAQARTKRVGVVDARNASGLNYKDVMYGEVTVKWVWDGGKFVARKVCEVKEKNGVISVWSFDEHDDIVTSEVQQPMAGEK